MQETQVQSLGWEDPLEKAMATHSSILAWKIPWTDEPGRLQSTGSQKSWNTSERQNNHHSRVWVCNTESGSWTKGRGISCLELWTLFLRQVFVKRQCITCITSPRRCFEGKMKTKSEQNFFCLCLFDQQCPLRKELRGPTEKITTWVWFTQLIKHIWFLEPPSLITMQLQQAELHVLGNTLWQMMPQSLRTAWKTLSRGL